ncbi:MAG TPA: hypothetical protein VIJ19_10560 [Opitutaceae bacterium]
MLLLFLSRPRLAPLSGGATALRGRDDGAHALDGPSLPSPAPEERSALADDLNSPKTDVHSDLRLINQIFIAYRSGVRDGNPVGENAEITAALKGKNKIGFAFIPPDCPALNAKGELCDRWGDPYFFHQISGERMEIRSAGPDRVLWTGDDEVLTP